MTKYHAEVQAYAKACVELANKWLDNCKIPQQHMLLSMYRRTMAGLATHPDWGTERYMGMTSGFLIAAQRLFGTKYMDERPHEPERDSLAGDALPPATTPATSDQAGE